MKHAEFISRLDEAQILAAIQAAERKTSGLLRVFISRRSYALAAAEKHFNALGLRRTPQHNAVLIFVAPKSRTFAIFGDAAVHQRCGESFWTALRDEMTTHLKDSRYTDALVHAITRAGDLLATHFPPGTSPDPAPDSSKLTRD